MIAAYLSSPRHRPSEAVILYGGVQVLAEWVDVATGGGYCGGGGADTVHPAADTGAGRGRPDTAGKALRPGGGGADTAGSTGG